jgi:drug/metabolite transporter (DMT)-like permease
VSAPSFAAFVYLTIVGSIVAFTTFGWMIRVAPLPLVATYAYVNPVVAVILGAIILDEPIEPRTVLAGGVIVAAVALIVTARGRMARPQPSADLRLRQHRPGNRRASAITVSIGLTPMAVGKSDASAT